jgi:hypothetical protein
MPRDFGFTIVDLRLSLHGINRKSIRRMLLYVGIFSVEALNLVVKGQRTNVQRANSYYTTFWDLWAAFTGFMGSSCQNFKVVLLQTTSPSHRVTGKLDFSLSCPHNSCDWFFASFWGSLSGVVD